MNNCVLNACLSRQVYSGKDIISITISQEKGYIKCEIIENTNKNRVNSTNLLSFLPFFVLFNKLQHEGNVGSSDLIPREGFYKTLRRNGIGCGLQASGMCQQTDNLVGRETLTQASHVKTLVALRQALASGVAEERQMGEAWWCEA